MFYLSMTSKNTMDPDSVLDYLEENKGTTAREVGRVFGVPKKMANKVLYNLVDYGAVKSADSKPTWSLGKRTAGPWSMTIPTLTTTPNGIPKDKLGAVFAMSLNDKVLPEDVNTALVTGLFKLLETQGFVILESDTYRRGATIIPK